MPAILVVRQVRQSFEVRFQRLVKACKHSIRLVVHLCSVGVRLGLIDDRNRLSARLFNAFEGAGSDGGEKRDAKGRAFLGVDGDDLGAENVGHHLTPERTSSATAGRSNLFNRYAKPSDEFE